MIDLVKLYLQAGDGGDGRVSFRREKYVPRGGPDGGTGGDGGHVIIRGAAGVSSLQHYVGVKEYAAEDGQDGGKKKMKGAKGNDMVLEVPLGTVVWLLAENQESRVRRGRYPLEYTLGRDEVQFEFYTVEKEGQAIPYRPESEIEPILTETEVEALTASVSDEKNAKDDVGEEETATLKRQARLLKKVINRPADVLSDLDFRHLPKQQLVEITEVGQEVVLCQGGFGGRGNETFKGPANTTPMEAHYGTFGERKVVVLEQKLLADIGLVGFPNAGKSTLISVLTDARPKVGNYPFTTLEPHLGVVQLSTKKGGHGGMVSSARDIVIADIPGLIEGASEGKGLGHTFLRHIEHSQTLLYVLFIPESILFNGEIDQAEQVAYVWQQFQELKQELSRYESLLLEKPYLVSLNKIDLYTPKLQQAVQEYFASQDEKLILFSAVTQEGIEQLRTHIGLPTN